MACLGLGGLALQKGELQQAIAVLERGLPRSQAVDHRQLFPLVAAPLGAAYALGGQVAEALSLLEQAVEQASATKFMGLQARRVAWLSETYLLAGRRDEAMRLAQRALELAGLHKERGHEAWALRLLGEIASRGMLYARIDHREGARNHLSKALDLYRAIEMTLWLSQAEGRLVQMEGAM